MSIKSKLFFTLFVSGFLFLSAQNKIKETLPGTSQSLDLVYIKGGTFTMGSPKSEAGHFGDEGPSHEVTVEDFWMGQYEITWDLYNLFVSREIDAFQSKKNPTSEVQIDVDAVSGATTPYVEMSFGMGTEGYPAICMTQLAAVKFCEWLSAMTGHFYRLPTEAEWEYACRAGSTTSYSFGNEVEDLDEYAWYASNSNEKYQLVGTKKPNAWGLYDMHGNVTEWTLDQYVPTAYKSRKGNVKNPFQEPDKVYPKVVRGGSWMDAPNRLRSASRRPSSKKWKMRDPQIPKSKWWHTDAPFVGFRVVRPVKTPTEDQQRKYWNYESTQ
ncbi:formylglycine-generating enzyme family protein [Flavobacteriaceae bacterium]|jgi:formylglycine-generating enzyme required for sulfatase activity|nr:formylglycine-generating enzyme family protein [Flavobacteriaceae bacterium]MDA7808090.1 formylglycine-generating enzyme family protein [Flavobacteriaceae bacterium]MDA9587458.1 formylglycine-generating enzyme family protein [Flavobacteriaceae bacterium]MDA9851216.1 formylglycine-generating enzyme family protein [Flavobacteriaceae bacterium]